jgi:hypothetical protein
MTSRPTPKALRPAAGGVDAAVEHVEITHVEDDWTQVPAADVDTNSVVL